MKHKRTTRNKKLKSNMLDKSLVGWEYGRGIAKEATLRKEWKNEKKSLKLVQN